jgi:hypothetical protein
MNDPRAVARSMLQRHDVSLHGLWAWYRANGGDLPPLDFEAILYGLQEPEPFELEVLDWALEDAAPG